MMIYIITSLRASVALYQRTAVEAGISERMKKHAFEVWKDWERFCGLHGQQRKKLSGFLTKLE